MNSICLTLLIVAANACTTTSHYAPTQPAPPNIIFILTDDQGWGDLGCHGHPFLETPFLDALALQSTQLTDFQVSPTCAPTRSALMTGNLPFQNGVTHTILERERLRLDAKTLPEYLHDAGYTTAIFGKWHLGDEPAYQPDRRGFDEVFIHGAGGIGQAYPGSCADAPPNSKNRYFDPVIKHNGAFVKTNGFCTDVFFDAAIDWIDAHKHEPFFAYVSTNAPHGPYICPPEYAERYANDTDKLNLRAFCGMITNIDDNVGRLLEHLRANKLDDNTIVIFMTDNGSSFKLGSAGMKGQKGSAHEGGTHVPAFFRWPGHFEPNRKIDTLTRHVDLLPTLCALAGAQAPDDITGRSLLPLLTGDAINWPEDRTTFFHRGRWGKPGLKGNWGGGGPASGRNQGFAVRTEQWRLVGPTELYDVIADPFETNNLFAQEPEQAASMRAAYEQWWDDMQVHLVNETVPLAKTHPFHDEYNEQTKNGSLPTWKPTWLNDQR